MITDMEVLQDPLYTFYASLTWYEGYLGLQSEGGTGYTRHVHFSVWDPPTGGEADLVWTNNGVVAQRFGGEGTDWEVIMPYPWVTNVFYRLCISETNVTTNTFYTAYFFDPATGLWTTIATLVRHDGPHSISYSSSFVEDFGATPNSARSAFFGNCWLKTNTTSSSGWMEVKTANFQAVNPTPTNYHASIVGNVFYMGTGGTITNPTPNGTILTRATYGNSPDIVSLFITNKNGLHITWPTLPFNSYQIQRTFDLRNWQISQNVVMTSNNWIWPVGTSNEFVRVLIQGN